MSFDNKANLEKAKKIFVELNGFENSRTKIDEVDKRIRALNTREFVVGIVSFVFLFLLILICMGVR